MTQTGPGCMPAPEGPPQGVPGHLIAVMAEEGT